MVALILCEAKVCNARIKQHAYHYQTLDGALDRALILEKNGWIDILCMLFNVDRNGNGNIR